MRRIANFILVYLLAFAVWSCFGSCDDGKGALGTRLTFRHSLYVLIKPRITRYTLVVAVAPKITVYWRKKNMTILRLVWDNVGLRIQIPSEGMEWSQWISQFMAILENFTNNDNVTWLYKFILVELLRDYLDSLNTGKLSSSWISRTSFK